MHASAKPCLLAIIILAMGCGEAPPEPAAPADANGSSVWSVDLIRTLPGQQTEYLRNIENNWAQGRRLARQRDAVLSYRALVAPPDSARGWDVVLMTEYADSAAWADREAIFQEIFASPEYTRVPMELPSAEVRAFVAGGVVMRALIDE